MRTDAPERESGEVTAPDLSEPLSELPSEPRTGRLPAVAVTAHQAGWRRIEAPAAGPVESGAWLNSMVHDIRQPLSALQISGASLEGGLDELEMQSELRALRAGIEYLTELVDELADGQAISTGDLVVRPGRVDMVGLVSEVVTTFQPRARVLGKRLGAILPSAQVELRTDRALAKRVLCNLVDNAIRHGRKRGRILLRLARLEGGVELTVEDDGVGLSGSLELTEHGAVRARGGFGVGLLFCARATEALGGALEVGTSGTSRLRVSLPSQVL